MRFLTRHFFDRFFDKDSISPGSDPSAGVIQTLSMLAVPGLMLTFWMKISPYFFVPSCVRGCDLADPCPGSVL